MASLEPLFESTLNTLNGAVQALSVGVEPAKFEARGFRHSQKHDLLACYLKAVRIVSSLNACLHLLKGGYVQEVYVLCRCIEEYGEDINFMSFPDGPDGKPSADQVRFVKEYFQEEFTDPDDPITSHKNRDRVGRKKIHARLARLQKPSDPSSVQTMAQAIHKTFSGFVHAAYVHTMDLYNGRDFHTRGMLGTPRIRECEDALASYIYRAAITIALLARRMRADQIADALGRLVDDFGRDADCLPPPGKTPRRSDARTPVE
jgi:hypothetical protein